MEIRYVVFVIVLLLRILMKKMGMMLSFVRVAVVVGCIVHVRASQTQLFDIFQTQIHPLCVSTVFCQIRLFK